MQKPTMFELNAFFQAMDKNHLPYREVPLTEEEQKALIVIYNRKTKQYYTCPKDTQLSKDEKIVTPSKIFSRITKNIDIIKKDDDFSM